MKSIPLDIKTLPPAHTKRLNSLKKLKADGFQGVDESLEISLREYGLVWREIEGNFLFIYSIGNGKYDRVTMAANTDLYKEFNWVKWEEFLDCQGIPKTHWDILPFEQKLFDLFSYYGYEEIFGTSYWEGFEIKG